MKKAKVFTRLAKNDISVDMIIQSYARKASNTNDIAFTIAKSDLDKFNSIVDKIDKDESEKDAFVPCYLLIPDTKKEIVIKSGDKNVVCLNCSNALGKISNNDI